jgi:hypothetical protein
MTAKIHTTEVVVAEQADQVGPLRIKINERQHTVDQEPQVIY